MTDDMRRLMESAGRRREQREREWAEIQAEKRRRAADRELLEVDPEAWLRGRGLIKPETHGLPAAPTCEGCRYPDEELDVAEWQLPELCDAHAEEGRRSIAIRALAAQIDEQHLRAPIEHLHPALAHWNATNGVGAYLYGPPGTGKTDTASILCRKAFVQIWKYRGTPPRIAWFPVVRGLAQVQAGFDRDRPSHDVTLFSAAVLVLDDIGMEHLTAWQSSFLYGLINDRMVNGHVTIYTANFDVGQLASRMKSPPIASRIAGHSHQVDFAGRPDYRLHPAGGS